MNYKQYIINMILQFDTNHTKEYLYTLQVRDLVYIKDECFMSNNIQIKPENIIELIWEINF